MLSDILQLLSADIHLAVLLMFVLGMAFLAIKADDIIIYVAAAIGIGFIAAAVGETSITMAIPVILIAVYMGYRGIRLYV